MSLATKDCIPCKGGIPPLSHAEATHYLEDIPGWELSVDAKRIQRKFKFNDFVTALSFVNAVSELAENQGHHPEISFGWGYCTVTLYTYKINGLHENDFIMAAKITERYSAYVPR